MGNVLCYAPVGFGPNNKKEEVLEMKKFFVLLLVLLLVFSAAACGDSEPEETPTPSETPEENMIHEEEYEEEHEEYEEAYEGEEEEAEAGETPFEYVPELAMPEFTNTTDAFGFVLEEGWTMDPAQGEGAEFIIGTNADDAAMVNVLGPHDVDPEWPDPANRLFAVFGMMLEQSYNAENLEIQTLPAGELGHAVLRADYTITVGGETYPGIGFIVTDGEQFLLIQGIMAGDSIIPAYLDFVSSIRFLN